jgi:prepilin-type N-terminal cleavage/methylation domain-containing protein/prepilin-type processing-associated H-X9-DG protein
MSTSHTPRKGFTLIELLVVIAIIAILIGLLVPAVQKVREAAARTQCANNMHNLAIACQSYHDSYKRFPPAVMSKSGIPTSASSNFGPNWLVIILPFVEKTDIYSQVANSVSSYMKTGDSSWRKVVKGVTFPTVRCPSDVNHDTPWTGAGGGWTRGNYACNAGGIHQPSPPSGTSGVGIESTAKGKSPVYGSNGSFGGPVPNGTRAGGVMCVNWGISLKGLTRQDGTSSTVMLDEVRIGAHLSPNDARGTWAVGLTGASIVCAGWSWDCTGPNNKSSLADDGENCVDDWKGLMGCCQGPFNQATARGRHLGGVNTAFCDGSIRFINNNVPQSLWWAIHCTDDRLPDVVPQ